MARKTYQEDYYKTLGISQGATAEEIKKAYRQMALKFHPDRNPGDKEAEERFKEISEAYGVLIDPEKRKHYDFVSQAPFEAGRRPDFSYTQEEIFRDIFNNPMANEIFSELGREFGRMGFRFDERFFDRLFFGGRGTFFGGIMYGGPGGFQFHPFGQADRPTGNLGETFFPLFERVIVPQGVSWKGRVFSWVLRKIVGFFFRGLFPNAPSRTDKNDLDLTYTFPLEAEEITSSPVTKELSLRRNGKMEKLVVKIPAGVKDGTMLRLRGMGKSQSGKGGDLYLKIKFK